MHWIDFDLYCKVFTNSSTKEYIYVGFEHGSFIKDLES